MNQAVGGLNLNLVQHTKKLNRMLCLDKKYSQSNGRIETHCRFDLSPSFDNERVGTQYSICAGTKTAQKHMQIQCRLSTPTLLSRKSALADVLPLMWVGTQYSICAGTKIALKGMPIQYRLSTPSVLSRKNALADVLPLIWPVLRHNYFLLFIGWGDCLSRLGKKSRLLNQTEMRSGCWLPCSVVLSKDATI